MKKMKTVFVIDRQTHLATEEIQEHWVMTGEGVATIKFDGTSCLIEDGKLFKRYDAKKGRVAPQGFKPCETEPDPITQHWPGWIPVTDAACDKFHVEAFAEGLEDGTYELVGPKVQGNKYGLDRHALWRHGGKVVEVERTRAALCEWLESHHEEGLVFHHADGRMAKLRRKDFGLVW